MLRHTLTALRSYNTTVKAWLEFAAVDAAAAGPGSAFAAPRRVDVELYGKECPMAVENFARLCLGDMVLPVQPASEAIAEPSFRDQYLPQLTYQATQLHRCVPNYIVQCGDVTGADGTSGLSAFGEEFDAPDEIGTHAFSGKGMLGTAVSAPHKNTSQFFVTLAEDGAAHLDGTCICFGKVTKGLGVLEEVAALPLGHDGRPRLAVAVASCGLY